MRKCCETCKHNEEDSLFDLPCKECEHTSDAPTMWKPAKQFTQTNADRIRAMSDEELAKMLNEAIVCHHLRELGYCHKCPLFGAKPCDTEGLLEWLKQPAEGE